MSWKYGSLNLLEPSGPHRACYGTATLLTPKQLEAGLCSAVYKILFLTYDICSEFKSYDLQVYCRRTLCRHWNVIRRQSIVISRTKLLLQLGLSTSEIRYLLKYESPYTRNHHRTCQTIPKLTVFGVFFVLQISGSQRIPTDMRRVRKQWWTNIPGRPRLKKRWKIETGNSLRVSVCPLLPPQQVGDHLLVGTCLCWGVSPLSGVAAG